MVRIRAVLVMGLLLGTVSAAWAQEAPSDQDLRRSYEDALSQLKAAQDRKNELANENAALMDRIQQLQTQLAQVQEDVNQAADRSYALRSHYVAWQAFIMAHPELAARWRVFMEAPLLEAPAFSGISNVPEPAAATTQAVQ